MISLQRVTVRYGSSAAPAVLDLDLEVEQGETLVLLGESGCGKTTTLKLINRLVEPASGRVLLGGVNVADEDPIALRRRVVYVFQGCGLIPHLTVRQNTALPLRLVRTSRPERERRADAMIELVDLPAELRGRYPHELSGGQRQRVGVARALVTDPAVLLMDEPFGALDALTRESLQDELLDLKARLAKTIVFVTHDLMEALRVGDCIGVMQAGSLHQLSSPENIVQRPATEFVRQLFASPRRQLDLLKGLDGRRQS